MYVIVCWGTRGGVGISTRGAGGVRPAPHPTPQVCCGVKLVLAEETCDSDGHHAAR